MDFSFWLFAIICFFGGVFVLILLPETKGKSLNEIQELLNNNNNNNTKHPSKVISQSERF